SCWRRRPCTARTSSASSRRWRSARGSPCSTSSARASRRTSRRSRRLPSSPPSAVSRGRRRASRPSRTRPSSHDRRKSLPPRWSRPRRRSRSPVPAPTAVAPTATIRTRTGRPGRTAGRRRTTGLRPAGGRRRGRSDGPPARTPRRRPGPRAWRTSRGSIDGTTRTVIISGEHPRLRVDVNEYEDVIAPREDSDSTFDLARAEKAVRELLIACGEDPDRPGLQETPARVARAFQEMFAGLHTDPDEVLDRTFDESHEELVLVTDIPMFSTCEHHLVPFHGVAHVGYIPDERGRVAGLSKLARLVDLYA